MSPPFDALFEAVSIGAMSLRNRLVMSPMENQYASPEGLPSERTIDYFVARAKGGVGLITLGASSIDPRHKEIPNSLHFGDDGVVPAHRALVDAVHEHGAKIQPQLAHAGPDGLAPEIHGIDALGPSAIQNYLTGTTSRPLEPHEFDGVTDRYRAAALRVREAGYDGIELHAAHGYMLLGAFLTPWRNARKDEHSARTAEGRTRFVEQVVRAIKAEVGAEFPLTLRISGFERVAGGRASTDTATIAPLLEAAGVDAFHVSGGVIDRLVSQMVNGAHDGDALNLAAAEAVKNAVDVPVIVVGRIHDPALANRIVADGRADLVAMGRPLLADPELPEKARSGRSAEIRRCISCQNCIDAMEIRFAMDCAVNPRTGREAALAAPRASRSKQVVVVGGGPGGLEAARVAARRGHRVTLFEKDTQLGGALRAAALVHPENEPFLAYLLREVAALPIALRLGEAVDADAIVARAPDAVIVATGGRLATPKLPGAELPQVFSGAGLRALLNGDAPHADLARLPAWQRIGLGVVGPVLGRRATPAQWRRASKTWLPFGRRVVVVGGDLAGCELAEFLATRGRHVTIVEAGPEIAPEVGAKRRMEHMWALDRAGVPVNVGLDALRIERDALVVARPDGSERRLPADHVILAGAVEPDPSLYDALAGRVPERHAVGDCTGLGLIQKAVLDGASAACSL